MKLWAVENPFVALPRSSVMFLWLHVNKGFWLCFVKSRERKDTVVSVVSNCFDWDCSQIKARHPPPHFFHFWLSHLFLPYFYFFHSHTFKYRQVVWLVCATQIPDSLYDWPTKHSSRVWQQATLLIRRLLWCHSFKDRAGLDSVVADLGLSALAD